MESLKHVNRTHTFPFPFDKSVESECGKQRYFTQFSLEEEEAWSVVEEYVDSLKKATSCNLL